MDVSLSTPALLFPAIAILMLGYINRYVGVSTVIRAYAKDFHDGYRHHDLQKQLGVLSKRIELFRVMLSVATLGLVLATLSMYLIYAGAQEAGNVVFGVSLVAMILSTLISLYETSLSNKSLNTEIDYMIDKNKK